MFKRLLTFSALFLITTLLSAEVVTIQSISGKVEIQEPGASWRTAVNGMDLPMNTKISTGFGSEAKVEMDNATITVKPLTRMTVQELVTTEDTTTTKLFLGAGRIRADVRRSGSLVNDFQVRSPVATAAVRGTSFTFDGLRLEVLEGSVDFTGSKGTKVNVPAGGKSESPEGEDPTDPAAARRQDASVSPSTTAGEETGDDDGLSSSREDGSSSASADLFGTLEITIE